MSVRFYNPGSKISHKLAFDNPVNDIRDANLIAYWQFTAPEKEFVDVPTELEVNTINGPQQVSVQFPNIIQTQYKSSAVIRIDPTRKQINEDDNVALNEKDAREKGNRMWREHLEAMAREHIMNVERARSLNVPPQRAMGIYATALKACGLTDPADQVGTAIENQKNVAENADLQRQLNEMKALIESLTAPKGK